MAQKTSVQEDLRVQRTRKLIQDAMIALTVERGFEALSVSDIAERAGINRSTFYRHYLDKYDLLDRYMDELYALTAPGHEGEQSAPVGPVPLLKHIESVSAFYKQMLGVKGDPYFAQRFRQNTERRFRELIARNPVTTAPDMAPVEMCLNYISSASVGAILWWLENGQPYSAEQLAHWLGRLNVGSAKLSFVPPV